METFLAHLVVFVSIYWMLALSMDLLLGFGGLFNFAQAAIFGLGAYAAAIAAMYGLDPWIALGIAVIVSSIGGLFVGVLTLRLDEDYLALGTLGLAICFESVLRNWTGLTGGARGLAGIPSLELWGVSLRHPENFFLVALCSAVFCSWLVLRIMGSQFGAVMLAFQESVPHTEALGFSAGEIRFFAAALSGALAGLTGGLYAFYLGSLDPTRFTASEAFFIASMVIVGGRASAYGALLGAVFFVGLPELIRLFVRASSEAAAIREIVMGSCVIATLLLRPRGLLGRAWRDPHSR